MILAQGQSERRANDPWQPQSHPQRWKGFSVGVMLGGLCAGLMFVRISAGGKQPASALLSTAAATGARTSAPAAVLEEAGFTAAEERTLHMVLADAQATRATAIAYFESMQPGRDDDDDGSANGMAAVAADHRDEIDEVVAGAIRAHLIQALGATRAERAERTLGPLATFVADMSAPR